MGSELGAKRTSVNDLIEHFGMGRYQVINIVSMFIIKASDAVEVLTLSFIGILLECDWNISSTETAIMTSSVFVGMIIGSTVFGNLADRYGRKPVLVLANSISIFFGVLACVAPTFVWFCFLRVVLGCGIAGNMSITATILSETTPTHFRAKIQSVTSASWSIGSFLTVGIAALVLPNLGWRWFLFFVSFPMTVGIISLSFVDESIRFLIVSGQKQKAMEVIERFSRMNNVVIPPGPIDLSNNQVSKNAGSIRYLFSKRYRLSSILQCLSWFAAGAIYYGAVICTTNMPTVSYSCLQNSSQVFHSLLPGDDSCCKMLNHEFYTMVAISSTGDLFAILILAYILDIMGRKWDFLFVQFSVVSAFLSWTSACHC